MGMYTELVLKCKVADDIPATVKAVLDFLFNNGQAPTELPEHEFFKSGRWRMIGQGSSYYHIPFVLSRFYEGYIFSRSDMENYDAAIEKFLSWLRPYLDDDVESQNVIGWTWYDDDEEPTLIYAKVNGDALPPRKETDDKKETIEAGNSLPPPVGSAILVSRAKEAFNRPGRPGRHYDAVPARVSFGGVIWESPLPRNYEEACFYNTAVNRIAAQNT